MLGEDKTDSHAEDVRASMTDRPRGLDFWMLLLYSYPLVHCSLHLPVNIASASSPYSFIHLT